MKLAETHASRPPDRQHPRLPLWNRAVFVDWHGVLCDQVFWWSILSRARHPYHKEMMEASTRLFAAPSPKVTAWMRGELCADEVISTLGVKLDARCNDDYLLRRLAEDCRRMVFRAELLEPLYAARHITLVAVATDNVDRFVTAARGIARLGRLVDDILCSSDLGVLKADDPERFFGEWLERHGLTFSNALLVDDSVENCEMFEAHGGRAIQFTSSDQAVSAVRSWLASPT